ncbi:uncharacterized protein LOC111341413 [Stylophora pistillata]|uniref:uncharacterized protein LOC111341413 n=1 Tax=Stylophora pistillata TaxID=50429 RepID=UPI000C052734|nr:uncharacterized protein LOC111341413 [Stylophora pistillata]
MSLSNILSLFFGELESSVVVTLGFAHILIVSLIVLYKEKLTKTANAEPQIPLTPPSTGPSNELNTVEEEHKASSSDIETEAVTAYCSNGCQGACACPALESHLDIQRNSDPTLTPLSAEDHSLSGAAVLGPLFQSDDQNMRSLQKKSTGEELTIQYFNEKFHRESIDAGSVQTGSEFDVGKSRNSYKSKSDSRNMRSLRKKSTDENKSFANIVNRLHRNSHDAIIELAESEFTGSERRGSKVKESHKKGRKESKAGHKSHRKSFDTGSVQSGIEFDGSESTGSGGSENPNKTERKMSRFQKWRRRLSGTKKEEDKNKKDGSQASTEVTQRSSKHDTDSSKILLGNSPENATNVDEVTGIKEENMTA